MNAYTTEQIRDAMYALFAKDNGGVGQVTDAQYAALGMVTTALRDYDKKQSTQPPHTSMNTYIVVFYALCALCAAIVLYVFRDGLYMLGRWLRAQYNGLPAQLQGIVQGYGVMGFAYAWLRYTHWPTWLLIGLGILAATYAVTRHIRQRRDLQKRIRQMLDGKRDTIQGVSFLAGTFLLGMGYVWLKWILTHDVK